MKPMKSLIPLIASLSLVAIVSCGKDGGVVREAWNAVNNPLRLDTGYVRKLGQLPTSGRLDVKPWSDTYWPSQKGGVADRWFTNSPVSAFSYSLYTEAQIRQLPIDTLRSLSPAEKFDISRGRFDYPTVKAERARTSPNAASWEGICHGWAPAAIHFAEPKPFVYQSAGGVRVPFGSSDVKALLSLYQGNIAKSPSRLLGARCNEDLASNPNARTRPECRDTNAGSFHVVLANQIGLQKKSFVADVTQDAQVWNQPVHAFSSRIVGYQGPSDGAAPGTVREAVVQTTMGYTVEISPNYNAVNGTAGHADAQKVYKYRLELNQSDEIIGGEWIAGERPDFLWTQERPAFNSEWMILGDILAQSTGGQNPTPVPTSTATASPRPTTVPTTIPTTGPTPIPTARPTVTPTVLPTIVPTIVPTVPPIGPVPDSDNPIQLQCAPGSKLYRQQGSNGVVCVEGDAVVKQGHVTQGMLSLCQIQGGLDCGAAQWPLEQFAALRGSQVCQYGSTPDSETQICSEGNDLIGPFRKQLVDACKSELARRAGDQSLCDAPRMKKDFVLQLSKK